MYNPWYCQIQIDIVVLSCRTAVYPRPPVVMGGSWCCRSSAGLLREGEDRSVDRGLVDGRRLDGADGGTEVVAFLDEVLTVEDLAVLRHIRDDEGLRVEPLAGDEGRVAPQLDEDVGATGLAVRTCEEADDSLLGVGFATTVGRDILIDLCGEDGDVPTHCVDGFALDGEVRRHIGTTVDTVGVGVGREAGLSGLGAPDAL